MQWTRSSAVVLALLLLPSCGDRHGDAHAHDEAAVEHAAGDGSALDLDDGERWEMDAHTRAMFAKMADRMAQPAGDAEAAASLAVALDGDIDELIRGCTMTGPAHAALHQYLSQLIPAVERLAASGGERELAAVEEILGSYPRIFR